VYLNNFDPAGSMAEGKVSPSPFSIPPERLRFSVWIRKMERPFSLYMFCVGARETWKIERSETDVEGRKHINLNSEERRKMRKAQKELSYHRTVMRATISKFFAINGKAESRTIRDTRHCLLLPAKSTNVNRLLEPQARNWNRHNSDVIWDVAVDWQNNFHVHS